MYTAFASSMNLFTYPLFSLPPAGGASERLDGCWLLAGVTPTHLLLALQREERETKTKSLKCKALSDSSIVIAVEYFIKVLIADAVHCHAAGGRVVELRQLMC